MKTRMITKIVLLAVLGMGFIGLTGSTAMADDHGRFDRGRVVEFRGDVRHDFDRRGDFDRHDRWEDRRPDCRPVMVCPPPVCRPICPPPVVCRPAGGIVSVTTSVVTVTVNW